MNTQKHPELLLPAGSLGVLKTAVRYGADAVYIGGTSFSLRAGAANFTREEMKQGIAYAHDRGAKVYVTANIFAHNRDIEGAEAYFGELADLRPDAVLISDPGMFSICRRVAPELPIHISTQANNTNYETFMFWYGLGVRRVVAARELSLTETAQIRARIPVDMEIESFVHGAMCISYSGRCLLSATLTGRDANHGECTHPCRWKYAVMEETRPGEYFPIEEDDRGSYIFNSKDLCMIEHIPELVQAGVSSFKIEGRMKTALYAATIGGAYRRAIDDYFTDPELYKRNIPSYMEEIRKGTFREYTTGFFFGRPDRNAQIYDSTYTKSYRYLGTVEAVENGMARITQKNKFCVGDVIEILKPGRECVSFTVNDMRDEEGNAIESCPHAGQVFYIACPEAEAGDLIRICAQT